MTQEDMLQCQLAPPESRQKHERIETLRRSLEEREDHG